MIDTPRSRFALSRRQTIGVLVGGAAYASGARAADVSGWAMIDQLGAAEIADHLEPGISISVMKDGAFVYSKGFGLANLETRTPVTPHHVFHIGSITKQFTAASLVLLAEAGKLSFDDPLARYLPDFPRAADVTLRQMLHHTSGLGNYTDRLDRATFMRAGRVDYTSAELFKAMVEQTAPTFVFEPGTDWAYSNTAYVLLGLVVEKVSGEPYAAFFKRRLFDPAGMKQTAVDNLADVVPDRVSGYTGHPGSLVEFDNANYISMTYPGAAGSIRSTTEDLCRWHLALFGGKIVKPASFAEMIKPGRLNNGQLPLGAMGPGGKKPLQYGFGLAISTFEGHTSIGHSGGIFGFSSDLLTLPDQHITVAAIVNADGGERPQALARLRALIAAAERAALA